MVYFLHMKFKLTPLQTLKPVLSPLMQQSISILMLPLTELRLTIEQELENNPLLELAEENLEASVAHLESQMNQKILQHTELNKINKYDNHPTDEDEFEEKPITRELPLEDILLQQARIEISDSLKLEIAELIIGNLDEDGYLKISCDEIAQVLALPSTEPVEEVRRIIQNFEPIGIASFTLKECLLCQLRNKNYAKETAVYKIVDLYLEDLGRKKYTPIARALGISIDKLKESIKIIALLEPKPARNYRPLSSNIEIVPDVIIKNDPVHGYQININMRQIPHLRINSFYKNIMSKNNLTNEEKEFLKGKLRDALHFIKSIEQRGSTIREIAQFILTKQKEYFEGTNSAIPPMNMKEIALAIGRNESTICRAIQNKYIETPQGVVPIKFFFSNGLVDEQQNNISSRSIREEIKDMVDNEDKNTPLSDQDIQRLFQEKGLVLARRTVSKYRHSLKILPSHLRRYI